MKNKNIKNKYPRVLLITVYYSIRNNIDNTGSIIYVYNSKLVCLLVKYIRLKSYDIS